MTRILTGIQSSGVPHLGNILGAIQPAIEMSQPSENEAFYFIANLHSFTSQKDGKQVANNTLSTAAAWLAFGLDTSKHALYRQSDIPEVTELMWYLSCVTPFPMLANAHSFKDKSAALSNVNAGLFTYPVLMAADILLYNADVVPVGKDQKQHLEMTRDMAQGFNRQFGDVLHIPESSIRESVMTIPGIDGRKMSKSYGNSITIFESEKEIKKKVMKIVTDTTPLEEPKDPESCHVFALYALLAETKDVEEMRKKYLAGNYGYGHAKQELLACILEKYKSERKVYFELMEHPERIEEELNKGAEKARNIAGQTLARIRNTMSL